MADARTAILITIDTDHEGGFQKMPNDPGNWTGGKVGVGELVGTKYGITSQDMPGVDIENLTPDQAVAYYSEHYWKPLYSQINDQPLANHLFDMGVLAGVGTAIKCMQRAMNFPQSQCDGGFGPTTLGSMNNHIGPDAAALLQQFKHIMCVHYEAIVQANPAEAEFLAGWERRVDLA
jgi:lysozyme family protein